MMGFYRVLTGPSVIAPLVRRPRSGADRGGRRTSVRPPPPTGVRSRHRRAAPAIRNAAWRRHPLPAEQSDHSASASKAVSMCSRRATWLTHADTNVSAGRKPRSRSSPPLPTCGGGVCLADSTTASSSLAIRPRRCRSSTPRHWASSTRLLGCRWAIPKMARSGSTCRTGMSRAWASCSRHAATA